MDPNQLQSGAYWLIGVNGNTRRVRLSAEGPLLVGRGAHNHLVLNDYRVSRQHSRVAHEKDGFVVYDLNSSNGTRVNGTAVRRQQIKPNDEIAFGPHAFRVEVLPDDAVTGGGAGLGTKARALIQSESITQFHQSNHSKPLADLEQGQTLPPTPMLDSRETHPAEEFVPEEQTAYGQDPSSRDSTRFLAETGTVDLFHLENAYGTLQTLYAFMQAISKTIDRRELVALIATKILEIYPTAHGVGIYLRFRDPNVPNAADEFHLVHFATDVAMRAPPILPLPLARSVLAARRAIFDVDAPDRTTWGVTMYAPMIDRGEELGIIFVSAGEGTLREFTSADLEMLDGMAVPAAITLQNSRMHEESLQRERINRDLELAAQIQQSFLPRDVLSVPGVEFLATYKAAYTVGGDFYDVFWVGPNQLGVFVGDIAGKGIAAAMLMARISGELRVAALAHVDPISVFTVMNRSVIDRGRPEVFFTAIYFTLDVSTGEVWLATAGQPSPFLCHADGTFEIITDGASPAVGMLEDAQFSATRLFLEDGDSLVLYTDGVVEAAAPDGTLYGDERLSYCISNAGSRPEDISNHILHSVGAHTSTAAANDDMTIFICHRVTSAPASLQPRRSLVGDPDKPNADRLFTARR